VSVKLFITKMKATVEPKTIKSSHPETPLKLHRKMAQTLNCRVTWGKLCCLFSCRQIAGTALTHGGDCILWKLYK